MLKNLKYTAILSIATLYLMQLCFVFLGTLVENIQQLRYQNQIAKNLLPEHKELSLQNWQELDNKKEIKLDNTFYDVIFYKIVSKKVLINVVKDDFESDIRISIENLFLKKNIPHPDKKKIFNSFNYLTIIEKEISYYSIFKQRFTSNSILLLFHGKTNKIIEAIYRPPC